MSKILTYLFYTKNRGLPFTAGKPVPAKYGEFLIRYLYFGSQPQTDYVLARCYPSTDKKQKDEDFLLPAQVRENMRELER
jgi:hypothetical protein